MSTYGVIARRTVTGGFIGRLHQNSGTPYFLGRALYQLRNGYFQGDTAAMLRVLVDEHPAGWSDIIGRNFVLAPGFVSKRPYLSWEQFLTLPAAYQPQCYCHGERSDPPVSFTETHTPLHASFLYLIDEVTNTMEIYLYRWPPFVSPTSEPERHLIGSVALDGPEPAWKRYRSERIWYTKKEWKARHHFKLVAFGWLHAVPRQPRHCGECGGPAADLALEHFGYEGIKLDMAGWEAELNAAETENVGTVLDLITARQLRQLQEAQQQGNYLTFADRPLCTSCLGGFINAYLGEEGVGEQAVAEVLSSGGLRSYVLVWQVHGEEAQRLDVPCAFLTDAQTLDHLQTQLRQMNTGQPCK